MTERRYVYQGNPKDQHSHHGVARRARSQPPEPPVARLKRLGATERALSAYRGWWEGMEDDRQRQAAVGILGLLTDDELGQQIADVDAMHDWATGTTDAWARKQPNRALAAALALAVERRREAPRQSLLKKLASIS